MIIQLSSGQGPAECELAVGKLFQALQKEYPDIKLLTSHASKKKECFSSILFATDSNLSFLEGSIQWICQSPYRPHHKRKNWFVDVSILPDTETLCKDTAQLQDICKEQDIKFERFHCSGKGGQNVNKVETGVRLTHIPTGIVVTSTSERSQLLNRKDALRKLEMLLNEYKNQTRSKHANDAWKEHTKIIRGNPVRIYEGMAFRLK